jgi:hypothetical protein
VAVSGFSSSFVFAADLGSLGLGVYLAVSGLGQRVACRKGHCFAWVIVHLRGMHIRMLRKPPCLVSYGGFDYRVEPFTDATGGKSCISARVLAPSGRLWEPPHHEDLTTAFTDLNAAEQAWTNGFVAREDYFLQREIVDRLLDEGSAVEIEADQAASA